MTSSLIAYECCGPTIWPRPGEIRARRPRGSVAHTTARHLGTRYDRVMTPRPPVATGVRDCRTLTRYMRWRTFVPAGKPTPRSWVANLEREGKPFSVSPRARWRGPSPTGARSS